MAEDFSLLNFSINYALSDPTRLKVVICNNWTFKRIKKYYYEGQPIRHRIVVPSLAIVEPATTKKKSVVNQLARSETIDGSVMTTDGLR